MLESPMEAYTLVKTKLESQSLKPAKRAHMNRLNLYALKRRFKSIFSKCKRD